jgi:soluble lytic murein transglycosylase-like protein
VTRGATVLSDPDAGTRPALPGGTDDAAYPAWKLLVFQDLQQEGAPPMGAAEPNDRTATDRHAEDRSPTDRRAPQGERATAAAPGRRPRHVFRRFRQPLIGLGLAGMALPMVRANTAEQSEAAEPDEAQDAGASDAASAAGVDMEDQLADRVAMSQADQAREQEITTAIDRYGISRDLAADIHDAAVEANIEPRLAYGLVKTESTFNERAVSPVGARGLTQVMPRTAAWLVPGTRTQDLYDRQTNLRLGFTYLDQMITKYKGNVRLALLAYNRGPGTVDRVLKSGGNPDNGYADKVLRG